MDNVQYWSEVLESLLERDINEEFLTDDEFNAVNMILLHLSAIGHYEIKDELMQDKI